MDGIDEVIITLYARGLITCGIQEELKELSGKWLGETEGAKFWLNIFDGDGKPTCENHGLLAFTDRYADNG